MIVGGHFTFDLGPRQLHGADWIVLELTDAEGRRVGCRWHTDAADREIAFALRALADKLDSDPTKI